MDLEADRALYEAWLQDGTGAQEEAFQLIWRDLYGIAIAALGRYMDGEQLAQDCVQDAVIKIYLKKTQCREPERFRAWTRKILRNIVCDALSTSHHRLRATLTEDLPDWQMSAELRTNPVDLYTLLLRVVAEAPLSDRSRQAIMGRYLLEPPRSDEELAHAEGVSPANIQVTRSKNLRKLRNGGGLLDRLRDLVDE